MFVEISLTRARSLRLAKYISGLKNVHCIIGNHELAFLKYYRSILQSSPRDFDVVLTKLRGYFEEDVDLLDWELVDWFDALPAYLEEDDFICVHAGIPLDSENRLLLSDKIDAELLVHDRRFGEPRVIHRSPKCVFFGHTPTDCICGEPKILGYRRDRAAVASTVRDYYKIHLDTGTWQSGVLGCFCIETLKVTYVRKKTHQDIAKR